MVKIKSRDLEKYQKSLKDIRIAVIGDIMLDVYYWGRTERISPEAPVPVVDVAKEEIKPGGAANVALNIRSLGAHPDMYGVIGNDMSGSTFIESLKSLDIETGNIIIDKERPTTVKTRILASDQHVVRFDREMCDNINKNIEKKLLKFIKENIKNSDAIIFQDYNKGLLTPYLIEETIKFANENNIFTAVDPKSKNIRSYKNAGLFKPNLKETEQILNRKITTDEDIFNAGAELVKELGLKYLLITLSGRGMALFSESGKMSIIPAKAAKIANVSGAGDTVIAVIISYMCAGASFEEACTIANYAASIVVEDVSIIPVRQDELLKRLKVTGVIEN